MLVMFLMSALFAIFSLILFIFTFFNKSIVPPTDVLRLIDFGKSDFFLITYNFSASVLASALFLVYVVLTFFLMFMQFEKTQAIEIFYFCGFLLACLCEGIKCLIPLFGLWQTFSSRLLLLGRLVLLGKMLAPMSILLVSLFNNFEQKQDSEKNLTIAITVCAIFSLIIPINTSMVYSSNALSWGFSGFFFIMRALIFFVAIISFVIKIFLINNIASSRVILSQIIWLSLAIFGYAVLSMADNFLFLAIGALFLFIPTMKFLKTTHQLYA